MVLCAFKEISSLLLGICICICKVIYTILLLSFICLLSRSVRTLLISFLILMLYLLYFPLSILLEVCQFYWSFQRTSFLFHQFYVFNFSDLYSLLFSTFCLFGVYFAIPFLVSWSREIILLVWNFFYSNSVIKYPLII